MMMRCDGGIYVWLLASVVGEITDFIEVYGDLQTQHTTLTERGRKGWPERPKGCGYSSTHHHQQAAHRPFWGSSSRKEAEGGQRQAESVV